MKILYTEEMVSGEPVPNLYFIAKHKDLIKWLIG